MCALMFATIPGSAVSDSAGRGSTCSWTSTEAERTRQYATKLDTYSRYREFACFRAQQQRLAVVLVVTTRRAAEVRFARQASVAQPHHGRTPLHLFLTTATLSEAHAGQIGTAFSGVSIVDRNAKLDHPFCVPGNAAEHGRVNGVAAVITSAPASGRANRCVSASADRYGRSGLQHGQM